MTMIYFSNLLKNESRIKLKKYKKIENNIKS